jgi:hypothetical protein
VTSTPARANASVTLALVLTAASCALVSGAFLLGAGFISARGAFGIEYGVYAIVGRAAALPGGFFGGWLGSWTWQLVAWAAVLAVLRTAGFMACDPGRLQLAAYANTRFTPLPPWLVAPLGAVGLALREADA